MIFKRLNYHLNDFSVNVTVSVSLKLMGYIYTFKVEADFCLKLRQILCKRKKINVNLNCSGAMI